MHRSTHRKFLALGFIVSATVLASAAWGQMAISERLRRAESEHFVYIYQQSMEDQLTNLVKSCEDAYALLTPVFRWEPRRKTAVLFDDSWDEHNGWADVYPWPRMQIYAADVSPGSSIYEPGNHIRNTVIHEFTHILAMDAQYDTDAVLAALFGRFFPVAGDPLSTLIAFFAAPPGALAPTWYLEGLSIWSETEFAGPGRGRNSMADMILRMPVADHRALPPPEWDLRLPEWPYGDAAYLYGMRTIQYAQEKYGAGAAERNVPGELSDSVAHSFLYRFDACAVPVTGESFAELADGAAAKERDRQGKRIATLKSVPLTPLPKLTPDRLQVSQPKFGPAGAAVYFSGGGEAERDTLFRYDVASGKVAKLDGARTQFGVTRIAASADRETLLYTRLNTVGRDRFWSEVNAFDPRRERARRITGEGRYRTPALSPDGHRLAAVRNEAGRRILVEVALAQAGNRAAERVLVQAPAFHTLTDPVFSPDGRHLFYVLSGQEGSQIRRLEPASGRDEGVLHWPCVILAPACHPSGRFLVFSADRNGVYNLYRMPAEPRAKPEPITHVLGGVFDPDFSPDGRRLAATVYDSYGYHLTVFDTEALKPAAAPLPVLSPDWPERPANRKNAEAAAKSPASAVSFRPYHSLAGIRFDYWAPWLTASSEDGAAGGAFASFSDPTGYQSLFILGGQDSGLGIPIVAVAYQYAGLYPVFTLYGNYGADAYADLVQDNTNGVYDYEEEIGVAGAAVSIPWQSVDRQLVLTLGYQYADRKALESGEEDYAGKPLVTSNLFEGAEGAVFATLEYFDGTVFPRSHSIEQGRYVSAAVEHSAEFLGGDLSRMRVLGQWSEYLPLPCGENHVLKLEGLYGTGAGDEIAQGFFTLGGFGSAQADATPGMQRGIALRGYEDNTQRGRSVAKAGVSYRFPLGSLYRGTTATMPVYWQRFFGELFYEGGRAWGGEADATPANNWIGTAGAEVNFSMTLLRMAEIAPGLGLLYAFDRDEETGANGDDERLQIYLSIKAAVNF